MSGPEPEPRPPAADVVRALGYDPDEYASIEWREDGQGIVLIQKVSAREITFTVGPRLVDGLEGARLEAEADRCREETEVQR